MASNTESQHNTEGGDHGFSHEHALYAPTITTVGSLPVTTALLTSWVAVIIIVAVSLVLRARLRTIPGKLQHLFEVVIEGGLSLADQVTNNRRISERVFPVSISIFFFVLINNWLGLMPLTAIGFVDNNVFHPFLRSGTADINTTIALAVIAVIGANIFGVISIGAWKMFNKYVTVKAIGTAIRDVRKDPMKLLTAPIHFFVGIIEVIGECAKVASLSFRLFGNVFAGEVLLASMTALFAYAVPIPFIFLEVLVGAVQAFIFALLAVVYFTIAASDHDHEEEHAAQH